jgi:hypothetical protein
LIKESILKSLGLSCPTKNTQKDTSVVKLHPHSMHTKSGNKGYFCGETSGTKMDVHELKDEDDPLVQWQLANKKYHNAYYFDSPYNNANATSSPPPIIAQIEIDEKAAEVKEVKVTNIVDESRSWTKELYEALETAFNSDPLYSGTKLANSEGKLQFGALDKQAQTAAQQWAKIASLAQDFVYIASLYARMIVTEM